MTAPIGIDFNAFRVALVKLVRSIGLSQNQIIEAEPEIADPVRPPKPYLDFNFTMPAKSYRGEQVRTDPETGKQYAVAQRASYVEFNIYGNTHEEAFNLATALQALLETPPLRQALADAGFPVWSVGDVANVSMLLNTGFEGRANLTCTLGAVSIIEVEVDQVDSVNISGSGDVPFNVSVKS